MPVNISSVLKINEKIRGIHHAGYTTSVRIDACMETFTRIVFRLMSAGDANFPQKKTGALAPLLFSDIVPPTAA
jgi:hypothetical protein